MKGGAVGKCWKQRTVHGGEPICQTKNKQTNKNKQRNKQKQTQKQTNKEPRIHGGEPICQGGHTKADLMQIPASLDFEEYNLENSDATYFNLTSLISFQRYKSCVTQSLQK